MYLANKDYFIRDELYGMVDDIVKGRLKELPFTTYEQGNIFAVNSDGTYDVKINGEIYSNLKPVNTNTYVLNDVVWVVKINGYSKYKYIFCKF